jgi:hypothetical protein
LTGERIVIKMRNTNKLHEVIDMSVTEMILEEAGLDQSSWGKRILTAEELGSFPEADKIEAECWTTCACGMLDDGIARNIYGKPRDFKLATLGGQFNHHVENNRFREAASCLVEIEARAIVVLSSRGLFT